MYVLIIEKDSIFANLEHDDWQLTAKSRVQGAWNLHELFPDLDFFVALSGMTGITGNAGQSVYTGTSVSLAASECWITHLVRATNASLRHSSKPSRPIVSSWGCPLLLFICLLFRTLA